MTVVLSSTSRRKSHAIAFGKELARAIEVRYTTKAAVADTVGLAYSVIRHYIRGYGLPKVSTAQKLADALSWPKLVEVATAGRTAECRTCHRPFIDEGTQKAFCSNLCMIIDQKKNRGVDGRKRAAIAEGTMRLALVDLDTFKTAVGSFCRSCEPDGICRQSDCSLRSVSPLPLSMSGEMALIQPGKRRMKMEVAV